MEIRNALKKIDNYLSVVQNLNRTILEEGTMAPDELKLMKKYLRGCIERIEDIEAKLNIADEPGTPVFAEPQVTEVQVVAEAVPEIGNDAAPWTEAVPQPVDETPEPAPVNEHIIIDPEQTRTVSQLPADETEEATADTLYSIETPENNSSTVVESAEIAGQSTIQLVAPETEDVPVIAAEEKRTWADLWEENTAPVNNGLVSETDEPESPLKDTAVPMVSVSEVEVPVPGEPRISLVADDEPESEAVKTTVAVRAETTLHDVLQTRKETGLFEMFGKQSDAVAPVSAPVQSGNNPLPDSGNTDADVLVDEIEAQQPEFSLSHILSQVRTPSEERTRSAKTLSESIALNDKFIFVRELFGNQFNEYENALRHLDNLGSMADAEQYCRQYLEERFRWNERTANAEKFYALLDKRFNA